jgi:hypothetical protein
MEVDDRHPLRGIRRRMVDVEVQVDVAALPVDDVLLDVRGGRRRVSAGCLRGPQFGERERRTKAPQEQPTGHVMAHRMISSRKRLHQQHDFSDVIARFHHAVCFSGVAQRKPPVDHGLDLARLEQRPDFLL